MRVLVTGMSGTGKSSLVKELRRRGYTAFDADDDGFSAPLPDGTWAWRVEPIRSLLDQYGDQLVFFAGCSDEQAAFAFDFKVLLTAPAEVILDRLRLRTTNPFGKAEAERDRVLADMEWVLPLLCASADLVIETTRPTNEVADSVIDAVVPGGGLTRRR
jgi:shikimate kinase